MRVLITGANGQLGSDLLAELRTRGMEGIGSDITPEWRNASAGSGIQYVRLDIADAGQVVEQFERIRPDAVIHCAAWTNVDAAEEAQNIQTVRAINVDGTRNIADACKAEGSRMMYLSTDYVFNGTGTKPWEPDCKDFGPLNVYAQSKLDGERAVSDTLESFFIVRTAWMFGLQGSNFVNAILRAAKEQPVVRVVNDQVGTPTYSKDLARLLVDMIQTEKYGYYHVTNEGGYISWYEFACEICRQAGMKTQVIPVSTEEYGVSVAKRPLNSRLSKRKLVQAGFAPLPHWRDALARYLSIKAERP